MITLWYIEKAPGEKWRQVSNALMAWVMKHHPIQGNFGFSEGDSAAHEGLTLFSFQFPAQHGEKIGLFEQWAKTTGRVHGGRTGDVIQLSNGAEITLPPEPVRETPPWLG